MERRETISSREKVVSSVRKKNFIYFFSGRLIFFYFLAPFETSKSSNHLN
jgi:hypothetical protein